MENYIYINGARYDVGPTPDCVRRCGFRNRLDVRDAANRFSKGEPCVRMDDVAEYLEENNNK